MRDEATNEILRKAVDDTLKSKYELEKERDARDAGDEAEEPPAAKKGEPIGLPIEESTLTQELTVLESFQTTMRMKKLDPSNFEALYEGLEHFNEYLRRRTIKRRKKPERLSDATIERYLIVVRRYMRYVGRPAAARTVSGPYRPPKGKRGPFPAVRFNQWMKSLPPEDPRLALLTWMMIAGIKVGDLEDLRYGQHITVDGDQVKILVKLESPVIPEQLCELLAADFAIVGHGASPLRSKARRHAGKEPPMTVTGIRELWNSHRMALDPPGPSMRDVAVVGKRVKLSRRDKDWIYEYRDE